MAQLVADQLPQHDPSGGHGHAQDAEHAHNPFLAHHFDTPKHQFEAGKLGIWIFLITEILFFGGLFCAYAIYRALHPEVFIYAHYYLGLVYLERDMHLDAQNFLSKAIALGPNPGREQSDRHPPRWRHRG